LTKEAQWTPEPVWTFEGKEKSLVPAGIRSPILQPLFTMPTPLLATNFTKCISHILMFQNNVLRTIFEMEREAVKALQ
jgi:hypothetical protein